MYAVDAPEPPAEPWDFRCPEEGGSVPVKVAEILIHRQ
jgi:hypothetical protein